MAGLDSFSVFYYGYVIDSSSKFINFDEGGGELSAELEVGSYTLDQMRTQIKTAMDAVGADTYTISVDRQTRKITISSTGTFSLLLGTGSQVGSSPFSILGFTTGTDTASAASHTSDFASGDIYEPQFRLQDYIDAENYQEFIDSKVNEAASGDLEVVNFGTRKFVEMSFHWITNITPQDGKAIKQNATGLQDARRFLQYITQKNPIEFMSNIDDRDTFERLVLESTPTNQKGTGYKLNPLYSRSLPDYYEINRLKFRKFD